jgi:hypothetical protein
MDIQINRCRWRRRGVAAACRRPIHKREYRTAGFISPGAAKVRHCMKRVSHRHTRRLVRAQCRASVARRHTIVR